MGTLTALSHSRGPHSPVPFWPDQRPESSSNMEQHHDQLDKLEEDNFYSALKLQKYGFGLKLKISGFVSFLAWTGILVSALGILTSMEFISDTKIISHYISYGQPTTSYVLGVVGILTSAVWMGIHLTLRKRNLNKDFEGIKKILKIKCYITGSLEIFFSTLGMMTILMYIMVHYDYLMFSTQSMLMNITQGGLSSSIWYLLAARSTELERTTTDSSTLTSSSSWSAWLPPLLWEYFPLYISRPFYNHQRRQKSSSSLD